MNAFKLDCKHKMRSQLFFLVMLSNFPLKGEITKTLSEAKRTLRVRSAFDRDHDISIFSLNMEIFISLLLQITSKLSQNSLKQWKRLRYLISTKCRTDPYSHYSPLHTTSLCHFNTPPTVYQICALQAHPRQCHGWSFYDGLRRWKERAAMLRQGGRWVSLRFHNV